MNHTPTPLTIKKGAFVNIVCPRGAVCEMTAGYEETRLHDAQFIITACNAHEELVAMVKEFIQDYQEMGIGDKQTVQNAQQLLATIEKGESSC